MKIFFNVNTKSSLSWKLLFNILLFSSAFTIFVTAYQLFHDYKRDVNLIHQRMDLIENSYLSSLTNNIWMVNKTQAEIVLKSILNLPDVEYVELNDRTTELSVDIGQKDVQNSMTREFPLIYSTSQGETFHLGSLVVTTTLTNIYNRLKDKLLVILGTQAIKTLFVSLFIFIITYHLITRHLSTIAQFANSVSFDTLDLNLKLNRKKMPNSFDELDQVSDAINDMRLRLHNEIKERKQTEESLCESEERFRKISENAPVLINSFDEDGRCLFWNKQCNKTFGWTIEEINEQDDAMALFYPGLAVREEVIRTITTDPDGSFREWHPVTKDGKTLSMMWANFSLPNGQVFSMGHDITTQKQIEDALKKKTHDIGERIKELKCLYSISQLLEIQNHSLEKILQSIVNLIPPAWQYPEITCAQIIFRNNQYKTSNFKVTNWKLHCNMLIDGKNSVTVDVYYLEEKPLIDEGPFLKEERALINEIAERISRFIERVEAEGKNKQLEHRLHQSQKMESIGTLAGGIAHDFNNLLYPIIGFSEMLKEDLPPDSPEHESAQEIFNAGRRGGELVKQILAFSRQTEHKLLPIRFQKILTEVCKLTRSTIPSDIEIHLDIQKDCGLVMAEATQLHQIAMNLITNAYHAVEKASGEIAILLKEIILDNDDLKDSPLQAGQYVMLSVSDNGVGIPREIMNNIFEPYFTTKEKGKGTGLGLAVVYGILTEHKGDIKVYSEVGKGTTFNVYLPLMNGSTEAISTEKALNKLTGTERILLVDDEESVVRLEKQMLERLGYNVSALSNSLEALETFNSNPDGYDLVISDMTMPNMTGDQLARELMSIRPDIPIVICTGFSERINKEQAEANKVKGFLMKPVVKSEMAQMVRKVLDEAKIS